MVSDRGLLGQQNGDKRLFQSPDLLEICVFSNLFSLALCFSCLCCVLLSSESIGLQSRSSDEEAVTGGDSREERGTIGAEFLLGGPQRQAEHRLREPLRVFQHGGGVLDVNLNFHLVVAHHALLGLKGTAGGYRLKTVWCFFRFCYL